MPEKNPDLRIVHTLAEILKEQNLGEIEYTRRNGKLDDLRIRVSAPNQASYVTAPSVEAQPISNQPHSTVDEETPQSPDLANHPGAVTAPMVGTVYLQSEPDAPPFIEVGQTVAQGDSLFIIEAMKTMNHIPSPHSGTVRRILVENSSIVEFGALLAIID